MEKYVYTTISMAGKDPAKNGLFDITMVIEKDNRLVSVSSHSFKPEGELDWDFAIAVNPREFQFGTEIASIPRTEEEAFKKIKEQLSMHIDRFDPNDRYFLVCYSSIPMDFVKEMFRRQEERFFSYFWSNNIDVMALCSEIMKKNRPSIPNMRLGTVAETLSKIGVIGSLDFGPKVKTNSSLWEALMLARIYSRIRFENLGETMESLVNR